MSSGETASDLIFRSSFQGARAEGFPTGLRNSSSRRWIRGRIVRAANCSFSSRIRRDDHVRIDAPKRRGRIEQRLLLPFRVAARRIFVAHDERRTSPRCRIARTPVDLAPSQIRSTKPNLPLRELLRRFRQPFDHEGVVTKIRYRMTRQQAEENDDRLCRAHLPRRSRFERRIIERALRSPHPVHDTSSARIDIPSTAHDDARICRELLQRRHGRSIRAAAD